MRPLLTLPKPPKTAAALVLGALLTLAAPGSVDAQDNGAATLLADRVMLTGQNQLIAEGNIEVYYGASKLTAQRVVYDAATESLRIEGPIRLEEGEGAGSLLIADQAELSRDLQNGLLTGARLVMARELQLAAARIERQEGRITTLTQVVASSCEICVTDPTPLWEIRARRVIHDADTRQLMFEGAQFRAMGVPLLYLPHLRMPDPTVERMSGLLQPRFRTTSLLGPGIKLPYFLTLGESADLTLTPYLSTGKTATLDARYRRAFDWGSLELNGALTRDSIREGETRGYFFGDLNAVLPGDYRLGVDLRLVSDPSYLLNYDISDEDRLWSGIELERIRDAELIWARLGNTHSIREGESNSTSPMLGGTAQWVQVLRPAALGGELVLDWQVNAAARASTLTTDGLDDDLVPDGRDMLRASMVADWRRNWLLSGGILATAQAELAVDLIQTRSDPAYDDTTLRALPSFGVELRWPWVQTTGRAAHVIEPVAQLIWSRDTLKDAPNEDSLLTEFDEGNLFSFSRFPGGDARERGLRANLGLSWTRHDAAGWSLGVTAGRVIHAEDLGQFPTGSGLSGTRSNWLLATHLNTANGLTLSNRALFDDSFNFTRDELRLAYAGERLSIETGYLWMESNLAEGRPLDTSELMFDTSWRWAEGWSGSFGTRYDLTDNRASRAKLGLQYANECVTVDLSLSRRFTSSSSVKPETDFGVSVELAGFGGNSGARNATRRVCGR